MSEVRFGPFFPGGIPVEGWKVGQAYKIAASGINVVLVARREGLLKDALNLASVTVWSIESLCLMSLGRISSGNSRPPLPISTSALSSPNAGTGNPGEFLRLDRQLHQATLRVSTMAHLDITHHFGAKLARRRRSGLVVAGAMGAENGVPCMANDGAAKAYVHSLGEALHYTGQSVLYQTLCRPTIEA